jgi:hypothetical protein
MRAVDEQHQHRAVDGQVAHELVGAEEPERRVERESRDQHGCLRQRARDEQEAEEHLDAAGEARELEVVDPDADLLGDVELRVIGEELHRHLGRRELLGERHDDERDAGRHAQGPDRPRLVDERGLSCAARLDVGGPAAGARAEDEEGEVPAGRCAAPPPRSRTRHPERPRRR